MNQDKPTVQSIALTHPMHSLAQGISTELKMTSQSKVLCLQASPPGVVNYLFSMHASPFGVASQQLTH